MSNQKKLSFNMLVRIAIVSSLVLLVARWGWQQYADAGPGDGFVNGNGRIEATEVNIATKLPGRIQDILVDEGDFVQAGQHAGGDAAGHPASPARRSHGSALHQAQTSCGGSRGAGGACGKAMPQPPEALVVPSARPSWMPPSVRLARSSTLSKEGAASMQELDDDRARVRGAEAALAASTRPGQRRREAGIRAVRGAAGRSRVCSVQAATATIARIEADIRDSELKSPRDGRVQFRVAQPGEVLGAGGRVLNIVDLSDVYMTFFLPSEIAGRVAIGSEVRLVLDVAPELAIPAKVSFVASTAQFTPKTVETASERQKLMFRVKAQIAPELLRQHLHQVKTGLPGAAWIKLDEQAAWPASLSSRLTE
jgi:HlyD family secretion protein